MKFARTKDAAGKVIDGKVTAFNDKRLKSKRFYFVDPFGYSQINLSDILSLLRVD